MTAAAASSTDRGGGVVERQVVGSETTYRLEEHDVVLESFADETVAVHLGTGRYFSIDLVGTEILDLLATGSRLGSIVEFLAARYGADATAIEGSVADFVGRLLAEGLVRSVPGGQSSEALGTPSRATVEFSAPTIAVYTDMEDLLLLDPIHDVDETGWPVRADPTEGDPGALRESE